MRRPDLTVFTPWYPSVGNPVLGNFVAEWSRLAADRRNVRIVNAVEWPGGPSGLVEAHLPEFRALISRMARAGALDAVGSFGTITRIPNALVTGWPVPRRANTAVDAIRDALPDLQSPVMHGHVGYFGGLAAARLARPETRVVVTEHSTELANVLATDQGREIYAEVLERAHRLTCVSGLVRQQILDVLPGYADTVEVVPNPVNLLDAERRHDKPVTLDKWVFAGGLIERKGVLRLLEAFIAFARTRPEATLDLFGEGALRDQLQDRVREHGLQGRVVLHGAVPRSTLLASLPKFDVLLAPSVYETFHLAVPEAVAAGLPVVVTRSGGPEEALGQTRRLCAEFVDVNDDGDELLAAVHRLETRLPELDLDAARAELDARFGPAAIRNRLADLYGEEGWGEVPSIPAAPMMDYRPQPERLVVFARRTWRSGAVEPQVALARRHGLSVTTVGVPQPKAPSRKPTLAQRAVRKLRRIAVGLLPTRPPALERSQTAKPTVAILGDFTSASDAAAHWDRHPDVPITPELDPTLLGAAPVDAT